MEIIKITYRFNLPDSKREAFKIRLDASDFSLIYPSVNDYPIWTNLEYQQCPHCKLNKTDTPYCPIARSLIEVVQQFNNIASYKDVKLTVTMPERQIIKKTTVQRGLSSLLGLIIATCGCPYTAFFRPMARFHLPLATGGDTIFRAAGMYLIAQYYLKKDHKQFDMELKGLARIYDDVHIVNTMVATRLRAASKQDSSVNALVLLDMFANLMPYVIDASLDEIKYLFQAYFD